MAVIEEIVEEPVNSKVQIEEKQKSKAEIPETEDAGQPDEEGDVFFDSAEYEEEELKKLIKEAAEFKAEGNTYFGQGEYDKAITAYENALCTSPLSLYRERAIYFANIAACHMKQKNYKDARDMCTQSLKLDPKYLKALLRRAQANEYIGTSTSMTESLDDYKKLHGLATDAYTKRECQRAERELPIKIKEKMEKEKDEMIGKLKDLGNSILGKFGLSTDNFQMQPDPSGSGGYSMNFVNK